MNFRLVCFVFLLGVCSSFGQNAAPDPRPWPDWTSSATLLSEPQNPVSGAQTGIEAGAAPSPADRSSPSKPHPRVVDRNFVIANMFQIGSTIANIEALEYQISHGNGPGDAPNGRPPSRALLYG